MTNTTKTQTITQRERQILIDLFVNGPQTRMDLGVGSSTEYRRFQSMLAEGTVKVVERIKNTDETGNPIAGRPTHIYVATKKGRDRVRRIVKAKALA